jgi:hypothetical protein
MEPNRQHDSGHFPRQKTFPLLIVVSIGCAPKGISGASEDRWGEPGPRCYSHTRINGSAPFQVQETAKTLAELRQALQAITVYAAALALPLSQVVVRIDGLYGNTAPVNEILSWKLGVIGRSKQYVWLDLPEVQTRLQSAPDAQVTHPESGTVRDLYDCLAVPLTPTGPVVRLLVATHPTGAHKPAIGVVRKETVYELFYTTLPPHAFTASDVLQVYLHRGSFETVLSDEDQEQDPDRFSISLSLWSGLLADPLAVDLEPPLRTRATPFSYSHAFDGICSSSIS